MPSVKTISTVPALTPSTTPPLVIVAILGSLLDHVPPVVGLIVTVSPTHISSSPAEMVTVGFGFTVISPDVAVLEQPVVPSVNTISTVPALIPSTTPPLVIVAILGSLLDHVPPVVGLIVTVSPTHISSSPAGMVTVGFGFTVISTVEVLEEHEPIVMSKLYVPSAANPAGLITGF